MKSLALAGTALAAVLISAPAAHAIAVSIPATTNIYLSGGNTYTSTSCGLVTQTGCIGTTGVLVDLGTNAISLVFNSVTGSVGYAGGSNPSIAGPDGNILFGSTFGPGGTSVSAGGVLSGYTFSTGQFGLVGVFLGPSLPGSAPGGFDSGTGTGASYSPAAGQIFFIGDGKTGTGSGSTQTFFVPVGATQLWLGFVDEFFDFTACSGGPCSAGLYGDNVVDGHLALGADITISHGEIPEPSALLLFATGLAGIAIRRFRRA